ncbi:hypothetical protein L596_013589 [Steinernema carpocapsae]|uniref:Uncharacterized protein n=1 Tax=Steinernema carpocapsae TaxID=34508 RepID=A0A4U5P1H0_STECR|nr:hypothetical protein L596_013589 [Steinernema carpocapsae]
MLEAEWPFAFPEYDYLGENDFRLDVGYSNFNATFTKAVDSWVTETDADGGAFRNRLSISHRKAQQVVAALTEEIGCAVVKNSRNTAKKHVL